MSYDMFRFVSETNSQSMGYLIRFGSKIWTRSEEGCIQHDMISAAIKTLLNLVYTEGCWIISYTTQLLSSYTDVS